MLAAFFQDLDRVVGAGNYVVVLTADHGFMPAPEYSAAQGKSAGRANAGEILGRVNAGLKTRFGPEKLGKFFSASALVLDQQLIAAHGLNFDAVADEARRLLLADPAVAVAYTRRELKDGSRQGAPYFEAMRNSWYEERSGDVQFALKPYWLASSSPTGTTHGSPYEYDTHVPILMWGPPWVRRGEVSAPVEVVDIAPTLAKWLGVATPSQAQGRVLPVP
jgi:arylsulfatase A-like enzyme